MRVAICGAVFLNFYLKNCNNFIFIYLYIFKIILYSCQVFALGNNGVV